MEKHTRVVVVVLHISIQLLVDRGVLVVVVLLVPLDLLTQVVVVVLIQPAPEMVEVRVK
jgi:hypothetical protein